MKLFNSTIWAVLAAVAVSFTSCKDDDDYVVGQQSAGAYFAKGNPGSYEITPPADADFAIPVNRSESNGAASATIAWVVTPKSEAFTFPATVDFQDGEMVTSARILVDETKLVADQTYNITASIANPNNYGDSNYSFTYFYGSPMVYEETKGDYTYKVAMKGVDPDLPTTISYRASTPNVRQYTIHHWGYDVDLVIDMPDADNEIDGTIPVYVHPQFEGEVDDEYGEIWVADYISYFVDYAGKPEAAEVNPANLSYYDPKTMTFNIVMMWYVPQYDDGTQGFGYGYETFVLDGGTPPADYTVSAKYHGLYTNLAGDVNGVGVFSTGADVASAKAALVFTSDVDAALAYVLNGGEEVKEIQLGENVTELFPVSGNGAHTLVVAAFSADGEFKGYAYDSANISLGASDAADWSSKGAVELYDPWILPGLQFQNGSTPANDLYPIAVDIQESKATPGLYRLRDPYHQESFIGLSLNSGNAANVTFQVYNDGFVEIPRQYSGFATGDGERYISNYEGLVAESNPDVSHEIIWQFIRSKGLTPDAVEDGAVVINTALWGIGSNPDEFGYTWKQPQVGYITLPDATKSQKRKARAATVAKPRMRALTNSVMTKRVNLGGKHINSDIIPVKPQLKAVKAVRLPR